METAAALALVVALAGCGSNNPKPAPAPTKSASASPSPSREVAPTMPPEAKGTDEAAAKAYVRHFIEVINYAGPSGDTHALRQLYRGCIECLAISDLIDKTYSAQGHISGGSWRIRSMESMSLGTKKLRVLARVRVDSQKILRKTSARPDVYSADPDATKSFILAQRGSHWIVIDLVQS